MREKVAPAMQVAIAHMQSEMTVAWDIYATAEHGEWRILDVEEFVYELFGRLNTSEARKEVIDSLNALMSNV